MTSTLLRQRGLSLVETMVTLVILAFGLLGLAGLQTVSLKNNQASQMRAQATMYGYDIIDALELRCRASWFVQYFVVCIHSNWFGYGFGRYCCLAQWTGGFAFRYGVGCGGFSKSSSCHCCSVG